MAHIKRTKPKWFKVWVHANLNTLVGMHDAEHYWTLLHPSLGILTVARTSEELETKMKCLKQASKNGCVKFNVTKQLIKSRTSLREPTLPTYQQHENETRAPAPVDQTST